MRKVPIRVLDETDMEFAETLKSLGVPKNVAYTLTYLTNVDEATSRDIEIGTGLRQPEVSMATKELSERGWIGMRKENRPGKGRPTHIYRLSVPIEDVLESLRREKMEEAEKTMENVDKLERLRPHLG